MFTIRELKISELRILRAYILLALVPAGPNGEKSVSLARFGSHEVRLVELPCAADIDESLWLELYAHDKQAVVDSAACRVFEEAAAIADKLMGRAGSVEEGP